MLIDIAKNAGVSAYIGGWQNRWPAVHRFDAATLFRLALERGTAGARYHAVAEEAIPFKDIAVAIGKGLGVPVVSKTEAEADAHFGWFADFARFDLNPSSQLTQDRLGWSPVMPTLRSDLDKDAYFKAYRVASS
jgi:TPR repeat protein